MNAVALGSERELAAFVLAGVRLVHVDAEDEAVRAWRSLDDDVGLVILSSSSAAALEGVRNERPDLLTAVLP
jgi:vacuolar-type H+-ATPase subunit F/Vma7